MTTCLAGGDLACSRSASQHLLETDMGLTLQHILCVDDEADILEVAQLALETVGGFQVSCLNSGVEAVAKAAGIKPDLILLDVMMPQLDGPSTLKESRKNPALDQVPIIFMTARVQPSEIKAYMDLGAAGVTPKPFDAMALAGQITQIWERFHGQS